MYVYDEVLKRVIITFCDRITTCAHQEQNGFNHHKARNYWLRQNAREFGFEHSMQNALLHLLVRYTLGLNTEFELLNFIFSEGVA